jgi:Uma2 family endonuclease
LSRDFDSGADMSTIAETAAAVALPEPVVLRGVCYGTYVNLRDEPANDHLRMVYHDGTLELMSPEAAHEIPGRRIGLFMSFLCLELQIAYHATASTTFRQGNRDLKKGWGKEPDESFYFANARRVAGKGTIRLDHEPPPDLWIEIDHRASSRGSLPLYAALGVPEVWRYRTERGRLWFGRLTGLKYEAIKRSLSLPMVTPALVVEALELGEGVMESAWLQRLQPWIRQTFGPGAG